MLKLVVAFLPWIMLAVFAGRWFVPALMLALAASALTTIRQLLGRLLKILDTVTFVFFVVVTAGIIGFGWMILATYLSLLINLTLLANRLGRPTPFTIQYPRAGSAGAVAGASVHSYQSVHHHRLGARLLSI